MPKYETEKPMANSLKQRWITGIILAAVVLALIIFCPPLFFMFLIAFFSVAGIWEYSNIVFRRDFLKEKIEGVILALIIPLVFFSGNHQLVIAALVFCILMTFIIFILTVRNAEFDIMSVAKVIFGMMYIPFLLSHFVLVRSLEKGEMWVIFILIIAFAGDTAALYTGKYFGKKKLCPHISPGKTVEGLIGLMAGSILFCLIYSYFVFPGISFLHVIIMALTGGVIGQLGDLAESAIKRKYGLKDASALLPGHGGLLDRMDCLLFIAPFIYYYLILAMGK